jgi:hypothetical protein
MLLQRSSSIYHVPIISRFCHDCINLGPSKFLLRSRKGKRMCSLASFPQVSIWSPLAGHVREQPWLFRLSSSCNGLATSNSFHLCVLEPSTNPANHKSKAEYIIFRRENFNFGNSSGNPLETRISRKWPGRNEETSIISCGATVSLEWEHFEQYAIDGTRLKRLPVVRTNYTASTQPAVFDVRLAGYVGALQGNSRGQDHTLSLFEVSNHLRCRLGLIVSCYQLF